MATTKERILVTLSPRTARDLSVYAKHEKSPRATIATRAIREWLDDEEDKYLSAIGDRRLAETKQWLTSEEFWGNVSRRRKAGRKS